MRQTLANIQLPPPTERQALVNMQLHHPTKGWLHDHAVIIDGNTIEAVQPRHELDTNIEILDLNGAYLVPGFFDTQVNGGGGVLLNDTPTVEGITAIAEAHYAYGTTAMLPTLISDKLDVVAQTLAAIDSAIEQGVSAVVGVHIEGPFLNPARKGVHDDSKFCTLDSYAVSVLSRLKHGKTLVTVAPEQQDHHYIRQLTAAGVTVAAGHTAADYAQTCQALAAGVSSFTHLYNAMTPLTSREPGVVGAALEHPDSWVGIIVDGYHVHDAALKVAIAAKPKGKVVLVTDAMPTVGADDKRFTLGGETIVAKDGRCATASGTLAGSDLDMLSAVRNTVSRLGVELYEAINMASLYPAQMMGLDQRIGSIEPGKEASMLVLTPDLSLASAWLNGQLRHFAN